MSPRDRVLLKWPKAMLGVLLGIRLLTLVIIRRVGAEVTGV